MSSPPSNVYDHVTFVPSTHKRAPRLIRPARLVRSQTAPDEPAHALLLWALQEAGLPADAYRGRPLQRRLPAFLRALRVSTPDQAMARLRQRPELLNSALSAILLGVSEFFRDRHVFAALAADVLPELAARRPLRVWSAGCSDGQELYSAAILLAEVDLLDSAIMLGTDCRADAIERARAGRYAARELEGLPASWRTKYFEEAHPGVVVTNRLRDSAHWEVRDLLGEPPADRFDLVLWRNMSIYLTAEAAGRAWDTVYQSLRPGGFLVVGRAERPARPGLSRISACIYRRQGE